MSIPVVDQNSFKDQLSKEKLVVVKFGAPWCGPCKALAPLLDQVAQQYPNVSFVEVNVDESPMLAAQFSVRSLPTLMAWKDGVVQWTKIGVPSGADLKNTLASFAA